MSKDTNSQSLFEFESNPPISKILPISIQHIMAMFVGTVTVPIIVGTACGLSGDEKNLLIQFALLMGGLGTLIQLYPFKGIGSGLPTVFSVGFTFVPTLTVIGAKYGIAALLGAQLCAGVLTIILGLGIKQIRKYFPPVVTGTIILAIGLSLYPIAINYMAGGLGKPTYGALINFAVAGITLVTVVFFNMFTKGYLKLAGMLLGVLVGYSTALCLGMVDFSGVATAALITVPVPFQFGMEFRFEAILSILLITVVNVMQSVGDLSGTAVGGFDREPTGVELSGGAIASGIAPCVCALCGLLSNFFFFVYFCPCAYCS